MSKLDNGRSVQCVFCPASNRVTLCWRWAMLRTSEPGVASALDMIWAKLFVAVASSKRYWARSLRTGKRLSVGTQSRPQYSRGGVDASANSWTTHIRDHQGLLKKALTAAASFVLSRPHLSARNLTRLMTAKCSSSWSSVMDPTALSGSCRGGSSSMPRYSMIIALSSCSWPM